MKDNYITPRGCKNSPVKALCKLKRSLYDYSEHNNEYAVKEYKRLLDQDLKYYNWRFQKNLKERHIYFDGDRKGE